MGTRLDIGFVPWVTDRQTMYYLSCGDGTGVIYDLSDAIEGMEVNEIEINLKPGKKFSYDRAHDLLDEYYEEINFQTHLNYNPDYEYTEPIRVNEMCYDIPSVLTLQSIPESSEDFDLACLDLCEMESLKTCPLCEKEIKKSEKRVVCTLYMKDGEFKDHAVTHLEAYHRGCYTDTNNTL